MPGRVSYKVVVAAVLACAAVSATACQIGSNGRRSSSSASHSINGSLDDWEAAVCATGSVITGGAKIFRNSVAGNSCRARNNAGPIFIGQWDDNYLMHNDIHLFRNGSYASAKSGDTITDFVTLQPGGAALQPLTQFGFIVKPIAGER
jgi:hypothetical protein